MNEVIQRALSIVGSQKKLADVCGVSQPAVHKWLNGGLVSPEKVKSIVNATGGQVQAHEVRPDLPELFPHPGQAILTTNQHGNIKQCNTQLLATHQ